jgi:hypothetical protein
VGNSPSARELLKECTVSTSPETFSILSLTKHTWMNLLSDPALSPRLTSPFLIFLDQFEVTLVLDDVDLSTMRPGLSDAKIERGYRLITFDTALDFTVIGFMAEISRILADAEIPILPISAFSRDHLLIKQDDLATALKALGPYVKDLC